MTSSSAPSLPIGYKILVFFQVNFGLMIIAGSSFELTNVLLPSLLPQGIQDVLAASPINMIHRDVFVVQAWVAASNLVNLAVGLGFVVSAVGLWRGRETARMWSRRLAIVLIASALLGQLVMLGYIYPSMAGSLLVITVVASLSALLFPAFLVVFLAQHGVRRRFA